jgi:hypothetical protein
MPLKTLGPIGPRAVGERVKPPRSSFTTKFSDIPRNLKKAIAGHRKLAAAEGKMTS